MERLKALANRSYHSGYLGRSGNFNCLVQAKAELNIC